MRTALLNAFAQARSEGVAALRAAVVVDANCTEEQFKQNAVALGLLSRQFGVRVFHCGENALRSTAAGEFGAASLAAFESLGGARNLALLAAASLDEDCVFFDDDCVPVARCLALHEEYLREGKKVVAGAYAGKNTGVAALMRKLQAALAAFENGGVSREFAAARVEEALRGVSDDYAAAPATTGFYAGGNLGVSLAAARAACFAPTRFRMEDALYAKTAKFFLGDGALFEPGAEGRETPVVFHKHEAGALSSLREHWVDAVQGASVALSINFLLENGLNELEPTQQNVERACSEAPQALLAEFDEARVAERREAQRGFDAAVKKLGAPELEREYLRVVSVSRREVELSEGVLEREATAFFKARSAWIELMKSVESVERGKRFKEKLAAFGV